MAKQREPAKLIGDRDIMVVIDTVERNIAAQTGSISMAYDGEWVIGIHFGREAEDSDMAGGAAYGVAPTLIEALGRALDETGWR